MGAIKTVEVVSACVEGLEARLVRLEARMCAGPGPVRLEGVEGPDAAKLMANIRAALLSCKFSWPDRETVITITPTPEFVEQGTLGLPVAAALIALTSGTSENLSGYLFVGGVTKTGEVTSARGLVPIADLCRRCALTLVSGPGEPPQSTPWHAIRFIRSLSSLGRPLKAIVDTLEVRRMPAVSDVADFSAVRASANELRALVVASCGRHSIGLSGALGPLALEHVRRLPSILLPLTGGEREIVERISSAAAQSVPWTTSSTRPLRVVHPQVTFDQMMGGGRPVIPGEVSLAHDGILYLEDVCAFSCTVLQGVRKAYIDKAVRVERANNPFFFPADFMLVVSTPEVAGAENHPISFSVLSDLIDLHVALDERVGGSMTMASTKLATIVARGRAFRVWRLSRAWEEPHGIGREHVQGFQGEADRALNHVLAQHGFTSSMRMRIERVARTIADVEESEHVSAEHVLEAATLVNR